MSEELLLRTPVDGDDQHILELFDATLSLGTPLAFPLARAARYRDLCVGWYLGPGRDDAAVVTDANDAASTHGIVGYALVCTDEPHFHRSIRWHALRFTAGTLLAAATSRLDAQSRRFYRDRLRDAVDLARLSRIRPTRAHAHLNVRNDRRSGAAALLLRDHIDERCRTRGIDAWSGEINAVVGTRRRALTRLGLEIVDSTPNHTLSRRHGQPVERLVVVRQVSARARGRSPRPRSPDPTPS